MRKPLGLVGFVILAMGSGAAQSEGGRLIFPTVVSGSAGNLIFQDIFTIFNESEDPLLAQLQIYSNGGDEQQVEELEIPPNEFRSVGFTILHLVPPTHPPDIQGWASLTVPSGAKVQAQQQLFATESGQNLGTGALASANTLGVTTDTAFRIILPNVSFGDLHSLGIVNPSPVDQAEVQIQTIDQGKSQPIGDCHTIVKVDPLHRLSRFVEGDLCDASPRFSIAPAQVVLTISSDVPIAVSAMQFMPLTSAFAFLPVEIVEER